MASDCDEIQPERLIDRLLYALRDCGARAIFGIPGDYALPMFNAIEESSILPLYTLSHEPAVAYAADAAARISRGIGVAAVTYGPGALNLVNGIGAAYAERSPVAVISAAPASARRRQGLALHHQIRRPDSQSRIFQEVTCAQAVLDDPETAPQLIARTLEECVRQSLPVYIEIPSDLALTPCAPVEFHGPEEPEFEAVAECASEIADIVRSAASPALMIGVEVRRYGLEAEVAELARRADVPVVTSFMGRGVDAAHAFNIDGCYLGLAGDPEVAKLVEESDALILLGVIVCDSNLGLPAQKLDLRHVVHAFGGRVQIAHHIYPDIALKDLVQALFPHAPEVPRFRKPKPALPAASPRWIFVADNRELQPSDIAGAINELFSGREPLPIACDVGDSLFVSLEIEYNDLAAQAYYASMGFAVPAAFGIQAATGKRPLVLIGDGAFQMTGWELGNCQRYNFDPIVVVLNNRSWEMLRAFSPASKFNDLSDWHFADLAYPLGGDGVRVRTRLELSEALEAAWRNRRRFQLIEVMLDRGVTSDSLRRFVDSLKR